MDLNLYCGESYV